MIGDLIVLIGSLILNLIANFLSLIQYTIPPQIITSISALASLLNYFNGIFPIDTLFLCISFLITFYIFWYTIKVFLFAFSLIPWIGSKTELPKENILDLRRSATNSRNTINLRNRPKGTIGMKDIR